MKKLISLLLAFILLFSVCACNTEKPDDKPEPTATDDNTGNEDTDPEEDEGGFTLKPLKDNNYTIRNIDIEVEGLDREYHYIIGSDLHIVVNNDEVAEDKKDYIADRVKMFSENDVTSAERWETLPLLFNRCNPDAVILNADIVDFCSQANCDVLKAGLDKLTVPYYYLRADHDTRPTWMANNNTNACAKRQKELCPNDDIFTIEFEGCIILMVNNSLENIENKKLKQIKEVFAKGKPVILISHVPYESLINNDLASKTSQTCYFGHGTSYTWINQGMFRFIDLVVAEESPVIAIISGHLHVDFDYAVTPTIHQYLTGQLSHGYLGVLNLIPKK